MINENDIRIMECVKANMYDKNVKIAKDSSLVEDLNYDSLALMSLLYSLETEYGIEIINNENNYKFFIVETVNDIIELVNEKL